MRLRKGMSVLCGSGQRSTRAQQGSGTGHPGSSERLMLTLREKLQRLTALHPAAPAIRPGSGGSPLHSEQLVRLVAGACQSNRLGQHLLVRRQFAETPVCRPGPRSLRLLVPDAHEEATDLNRWLLLDVETTG